MDDTRERLDEMKAALAVLTTVAKDALTYAEEVMRILDRHDRLPLSGPRYQGWRDAVVQAEALL